MIRVGKDARGTNAFQTNRNIKLSEHAWAESVPNLDIENNDVRCSHASTVGPVDEEQRFYLESRGVPTDVAERLIVQGFFDEVLQHVPVDELRAGLEATIARQVRAAGGLMGTAVTVVPRSTSSRAARRGASTSTATASPSSGSTTTSTRSATAARTRTSRSARARCYATSARSSAGSTAARFSLETGEPQSLPRPSRCPSTRCRSSTARSPWCSVSDQRRVHVLEIRGLRAGRARQGDPPRHRPHRSRAARSTPSWARTARASRRCRTS